MKFKFLLFYKSALILAVEAENEKIVKHLLERKELDVNYQSI